VEIEKGSSSTLYGGAIAGLVNLISKTPTFKDIYAPLDGFVINAGIKLRF
jgi:iron complex outermembrane receptor protein